MALQLKKKRCVSPNLDEDEPAQKKRCVIPRTIKPPPEGLVPKEKLQMLALRDADREPPQDEDDEESKPTCAVCMDILNDGKPTEALMCGHSFHSECIDRYCSVTGRNIYEACPYKCYNHAKAGGQVSFPIDVDDEIANEPGAASDPQAWEKAMAAQKLASSVIG